MDGNLFRLCEVAGILRHRCQPLSGEVARPCLFSRIIALFKLFVKQFCRHEAEKSEEALSLLAQAVQLGPHRQEGHPKDEQHHQADRCQQVRSTRDAVIQQVIAIG